MGRDVFPSFVVGHISMAPFARWNWTCSIFARLSSTTKCNQCLTAVTVQCLQWISADSAFIAERGDNV